jgi:hypothetical protein
MIIAADGSFLVEPGPLLIIWTILAPIVLVAGVATLIKGRYGWFLLGLATVGLAWIIGALMQPAEGSAWTWLRSRRARA